MTMIMRTSVRLFAAAALASGLLAGCATTGDEECTKAAEQAITDAKTTVAEVKALNNEWRDTGKLLESAEKALNDGDCDEALKLANQALEQARTAKAQAEAENQKFMNSMSDSDKAALESAESSSKGAGSMAGADTYTVERGDSLWGISGKSSIYGDSYQWPLIYKANRDQIKDADLIYPNQVLDIDRNASSDDIDAAIEHAKTRGAWSVGDVEQSDLDYLNK
jgi:nucleoid-associated protein YgaU